MTPRRAIPVLVLALGLAACSSAEDEPRPLLDLPNRGLVQLEMAPGRVGQAQLRPGAVVSRASLQLAEVPPNPTFPGDGPPR